MAAPAGGYRRLRLLLDVQNPVARLALAEFLLSLTIYSPILTLFYTGRGLSLFQVLSLEAFNSAVMMTAEIPTGVLGDRLGVKRTVFIGHVLRGFWILILMFSHDFIVFLTGYALLGFSIAFISGAREAWVYELLERRGETNRMTQVQGTLFAASLGGRIVSALLAVVVVRSMTDEFFVLALAISAAFFFISAGLVATVRDVPVQFDPSQHTSLSLIRDGLTLIRTIPSLRRIVTLTVLTDPFQYALLFLYQPYFERAGTPLELFGIAAAVAAGLGAIAARSAARLEEVFGLRRAFVLSATLPPLVYLSMAFFSRPYLAVALHVCAFGLMQAREPLVRTMRNMHIASYNRATAISLISMLVALWTLAGKLIVGWIADFSLSYAFIAMALPPLVAIVLFRLSDSDVTPTVRNVERSSGV